MDIKLNRCFAPELFGNIIDHQDQDDLLTSSLVCSSWLSFARPRLFSRLLFDERRVKMVIDDPNIIDSPLSTIRSLIKVVVIYNRLPLDQVEIVHLFSSLKTITGLTFGNTSAFYRMQSPIDEKTIHDLVEIFHNITTLTLFTNFHNLQEMATFVCAFPFLNSINLSMGFSDWKEHPYSHIKCRPSPALRVLQLEYRLSEILPWLIQLDPIPQITTLTLKDFLADIFPNIGQLLIALGPSLKRLTLVERLGYYYSTIQLREMELMALCMQSNSELEYLQFSCPKQGSNHTLLASIIQTIISRATSLALREVSISVNPLTFNDPVMWERIDQTVASLPSPRLEKFTVQTWKTGMYIISSVQQSFPLCHKLGILQVAYYEGT